MKLHSLFRQHAVLQRGSSIPVWGWTKPNLRVRATLQDSVAETLASGDGSFLLRLPPQSAGGPFSLVLDTPDPGEHLRIEDLWIGEVWVCSGQSNMEWSVANCNPDPAPRDEPLVRMYTVPRTAENRRVADPEGTWKTALQSNVPEFSAVGYYFARRLHRDLGVPVGMIHASWGGTRIEAWASREALVRIPRTRREIEHHERLTCTPAFWSQFYGPFMNPSAEPLPPSAYPSDPGNLGEARGWATPEFDDSAWRNVELPATWKTLDDPNNGSFWYRRRVRIPEAWRGRDLMLGIGAVDKVDVTYVNGTRVGATGKNQESKFWNVPRDYPLPASLTESGDLVIAVRAFSFLYDGGMIGPAKRMKLRPADDPDGESVALNGAWRTLREHDLGLVAPQELPYRPGNPNTPHILFDSMVAPLLPYAIRGVLWYQGESNAEAPREYRELQLALIEDWRRVWGQGDFPFAAVQLAGFRDPAVFDPLSSWALLRESQLEASRTAGTGLVSAIDLGDPLDIHPRNKRDVGFRLAQWALADVYGDPGPSMGPRYSGCTLETGAIRITFDHVGSGLVARDGALRTVVVAGADRTFRPAQARIDGASVVASSPQVPEPVALRYAWADNPEECNLYNAEGLPAFPFRTDDW